MVVSIKEFKINKKKDRKNPVSLDVSLPSSGSAFHLKA